MMAILVPIAVLHRNERPKLPSPRLTNALHPGVGSEISGQIVVEFALISGVTAMKSARRQSYGQGRKPGARLVACTLVLIFNSSLLILHSPAQGVITTIAGGAWQFRCDGCPAIDAALGKIEKVTVDSAGNVFAGDSGNNLVVKISNTGVVTVVAGNGIRGFSGDGGLATSASLSIPSAVTVDAGGNLYIAERGNDRVRKVTPDGMIASVAGNGQRGFSGDGGPATSASLNLRGGLMGLAVDVSNNLYIADTGNHRNRARQPTTAA